MRRLPFGVMVTAVLLFVSSLSAQVTFERTYGGAMGDGATAVTQTTDGGYIVAGFTRSLGAGWTDVWLIRTDSLGNRLWYRTFGDSGFDQGSSVLETADSGYIVAGWVEPDWAGEFDAWLIRTDANGDTLWTRTYGGTEHDAAHSIASAGDGGYVLAGETRSFGAGMSDVWLIRTDSIGDTMWTRTYGGTDVDISLAVQRVEDGGYILVGYTKSFGTGGNDHDFYLVRTDADGDTLWTRTYGGTLQDIGHDVRQTLDGGYVLAGYGKSSGMGGYDAWLVKTDSLGDTMWTRVFGGNEHDYARSVRQTGDGGYVIAGETGSFGAGEGDLWLIRTDANGDTMWTRTYGGVDEDYGYSMAQTADGGYVITGRTYSFGAGRADVWLIKTDAFGDTMWTRTFGGTGDDCGESVRQTTDGGYIIAGYTWSFGAELWDVYLIKTDSAGNSPAIAEPEPPVAREHIKATIVRGVLHMPETEMTNAQCPMTLLDIAGMRAMNLRAGPNDVRHISPGIYFVRQAPSIHKVVITH